MTTSNLIQSEAEVRSQLEGYLHELERINDAAGDGALNPGQQSRWDSIARKATSARDELTRIRAQIEARRADVLERSSVAGFSADGARDFQYQRRVEPFDSDPLRLDAGQARDKALAVLERAQHLSPEQAERAESLFRSTDKDCRGDYLSKRALITESEAYRSAFAQVLTEAHPVLSDAEARALRDLKVLEREMNITTPGDGGYGVPVTIDPSIIVTDQGSSTILRQIATTKTITTKDWRGVSAAGVSWAFETESAAANDISPTLAQPVIHAHKAQGFIPFTIEVGMDYPDFAGEMARILGIGYDELLADKLSRGSGTGEPFGVWSALAPVAGSQVEVTSDGVLQAADITKMWTALPDRWKGSASWLISYDVGEEISAFGNSSMESFFSVDLNGVLSTIRQRPVHYDSYAPEFTGTTGQASIAVLGSFKNFYIAQRAGMNVEMVQHLFDTSTGTPNGQRGLYAWTRVGSDVVVDDAFRLLVST